MIFTNLRIGDLRPAPYNPRGMDEFSATQLRRSIEDFGIVEPLVVNSRTGNTVVGGHQRLDVLLGMTAHERMKAGLPDGGSSVPCVVVDLDERAEMRLNVALNAISGDWNLDKLRDVVEILDTGEDDSIEQLGFSTAEIERLMTSVADPEEAIAQAGGFNGPAESDSVTAIVRCPVDAWAVLGADLRSLCEKVGATIDTA